MPRHVFLRSSRIGRYLSSHRGTRPLDLSEENAGSRNRSHRLAQPNRRHQSSQKGSREAVGHEEPRRERGIEDPAPHGNRPRAPYRREHDRSGRDAKHGKREKFPLPSKCKRRKTEHSGLASHLRPSLHPTEPRRHPVLRLVPHLPQQPVKLPLVQARRSQKHPGRRDG